MVDKTIINRLLDNLKFYVAQLEKKVNILLDDYKKDYDLQAVIERRMEEAIECCIDIGNHIISDEELRSAKSYRDIFNVLFENKVISEKISGELSDLASFRNILVHDYADVDCELVFQKFKNSISVFKSFIKEIVENVMK